MMSAIVEELINEIKLKNNLDSDNKVGMSLGIEPSHLNKMKKRDGLPDTENFIKLAGAAGWSMKKAQEKIFRNQGFAKVYLLVTTAVLSIVLLLGVAKPSQEQAIARSSVQNNVYYVKLRRLLDKLFRVFNIV
jgi:hypothetical protein